MIVSGVDGRPRRFVILEHAELAEPERGCPFTAYGCHRLRWLTAEGQDGAVLETVRLERIERVLCVELDWADWVLRKDIKRMPEDVPTNRAEVVRRRYFINEFSAC